MSVKNLKFLSLKNVCLNLYFNYKLCKKYFWKIPSSIGNKIFFYYANYLSSLNENDLHFFEKDITSLTNITITNKHYNYLNILEKIDNNSLTAIGIDGFNVNQLKSNSLKKLLLKYFNIEKFNLNTSKSSDENTEILLKDIFSGLINSCNSLKVLAIRQDLNSVECCYFGEFLKNCFKIELLELCGIENMQEINQGLTNLSQTLKEIHMWGCISCEKQVQYFENSLLKCAKLEIFKVNFDYKLKYGLPNICKGLKNSTKTLKEICISNFSGNEIESEDFEILLTECLNLETVHFTCDYLMNKGFENICKGLTRSVDKLKNVYLSIFCLNERQSKFLSNLLVNCCSLEKFTLHCKQENRRCFIDIFNGLLNSSNTLKEINLSYCDIDENQSRELGNLLIKCSKIESLDLSGNTKIGVGFSDICESLINSCATLKEISLYDWILNKEQWKDVYKLSNICCDAEFNIFSDFS